MSPWRSPRNHYGAGGDFGFHISQIWVPLSGMWPNQPTRLEFWSNLGYPLLINWKHSILLKYITYIFGTSQGIKYILFFPNV